MKRARAAVAALAAAVLASPARAADAPVAAPAGVEAFASALRDGNPTRLLSVWPMKGSALLFGKKFDHQQAAFKARFDDGVFELMRWPKDGEKGAVARVTEEAQGKKARLWRFQPEGKDGPVCTLRSAKGGPAQLVSCVETKGAKK